MLKSNEAVMRNIKEGMLFLAKLALQCLTNRVLSVKTLSTFIDTYFPNMQKMFQNSSKKIISL